MNNKNQEQSKSHPFIGLSLAKLMRPKHWVKNGFVLAPLLFTGLFSNPEAISKTLAVTFLFCIASSAVYVLNDIKDINHDRKHPKKSQTRPLASGAISIPQAFILLACLYSILIAGYFFSPEATLVLFAYVILNIGYSFYLKHQPVLDIFTIAIGFVLRVFAGATVLNVPVSAWMFVTTLCLALFLAAIKRRQELQDSGASGREVLGSYSISLVNRFAEMAATGALVFYSLFVVTTRPELAITIPIVLFGIYRYWYIVEMTNAGESPTEALFSDPQLMLTITIWAAASAYIVISGQAPLSI
ncbi:phosphoribose diphosphate:decaprenyl-phosphate phosphoribosyltransferase [Kiloniella spongiae]|uniref:Phosphoribose diphosphate:decaprenyl-phosphate phosphoribosyltransferase n=1 Tax=Kiloniella spongiae TaxID=1489064 RepID=A0A0H2MI44_9PROT|nr:phosphoribose diphosphate--decaprenyl-phosphate phosphoribosyltransferase [Kiloniella spongiae]KLN62033.1 phosphoribose diphosphate:decaprenyl-phosphate phosphoribosyltransferase [Kiloniella spongiae]